MVVKLNEDELRSCRSASAILGASLPKIKQVNPRKRLSVKGLTCFIGYAERCATSSCLRVAFRLLLSRVQLF